MIDIRMATYVFIEDDGVVHSRLFEPRTVCGRDLITMGGRRASCPDPEKLPPVTCLLCLTTFQQDA